MDRNYREPSEQNSLNTGKTSGQHGPKPTPLHASSRASFRQEEKVKLSDRLRHDNSPVSTLQEGNKETPGKALKPDKQATKQATEQIDKQAEQTDKQATEQTNEQATKPDKKSATQSQRLYKSKFRMEQSEVRLNEARDRLSARKPLKPPGPAGRLIRMARFEAWAYVHGKIRQVEQENVGTEAAHKTELAGEAAAHSTGRFLAYHIRTQPERHAHRLENREVSAKAEYAYRKLTQENPELKRTTLSHAMQKHRLKRQYVQKAKESAKQGQKAAKGAATLTSSVISVIKSNPKLFLILILIFMIILLLQSCVASALTIGNGLFGAVGSTSYLAEDGLIDEAELLYTEWETDLQLAVNNTEKTHPGYDEYRYSVGDISHSPYELMAYLTAVYDDFSGTDIPDILQELFSTQYQLEFVPETEVRYRTETRTATGIDESGHPYLYTYETEVPYDYHILNVTLTSRSFTEVIFPHMNNSQMERYHIYMMTKGNRQYLQSPFGDFNWLPYVTDGYGYRVHPLSGEKDCHQGVDIALPSGTAIVAGQDGTVTFAGDYGDYGLVVVLEDSEGLVSKYAHCSALLVTAGQSVAAGQPIASIGSTGSSTGPHLHLEVMKDGRYLNPLYFAVTNDYGSGPEYGDPGAAMGDGSLAALFAEAEKHLGKPYVFGANGPDSFDCSSFVCFVFTRSGVHSLPRTTAQGIYNQCTPVRPDEAQPGDLIFFTGTYSTANQCSHVGIYAGNGMMIHAGNPVQYTSINTSYWQSHFYSFARLD